MSLKNIAQKLEDIASSIVSAAIEEAGALGEKLVADAAKSIEDEFEKLVDQFGHQAIQFVADLFGNTELSGFEKANLAATQLVDHAAVSGITLAAQDVTALIKNAYLAVKTKLNSL